MGCCLSREQEPPARQQAQNYQRSTVALGDRFNRPIQRVQWTAQKPVSRHKLRKARQEFWETRVTGHQEVWSALQTAIEVAEYDLQTAQQIIDSSDITVPTGDLSRGIYDSHGNCYLIPQYCISDPSNVFGDVNEASQDDDVPEILLSPEQNRMPEEVTVQNLTLKARFSHNGGHDLIIGFLTTDTVGMILRKLAEKAEVSGNKAILTMAYLGKVLHENQTLLAQGWKLGDVVNVLVRQS
ncbi:hypothetical protein EDC01DRAFT_443468 [Geopyxis carbonaria]|nr:hypothetical protein EDC01DRAFT_443468 [Geopyxis carbonaria]